MQNLYMMAALIREQEMRKMAIEIITGKINIDQAMAQYNVSPIEAVLLKVASVKEENKRVAAKKQSEDVGFNVMAA